MSKYLLFASIFVLICSVILVFKSSLFSIKDEKINGDLACVSSSDLKKFIPLIGNNLLTVNSSDLEKKVKDKYLCVDSLAVKKTYPDKIEIDPKARAASLALVSVNLPLPSSPPEATPSTQSALSADFIVDNNLLSEASSGAQFLADNTGFIFSKLTSTLSAPEVILLNSDIRLGTKMDEVVSGTLKILNKLKELSISSGVPLIENSSFLTDTDQGRLLFDLSGDLDRQLASLQLILQASKMNSQDFSAQKEGKNTIKSVDLRFQKPVVVYSPK